MAFQRFGAAALIFIAASGAQITRASACDERIAGSCPGAPITNPGTLVEAGDAVAAPAQGSRSLRKRRGAHFRHHRHRGRHFARRHKPAQTVAEDRSAASARAASTNENRRTVARARTGENVGISASSVADSWANVPVKVDVAAAGPVLLPIRTVSEDEQAKAAAAAAAESQPAAAEAPAPVRTTLVTTTTFRPSADGAVATEQSVRKAAPEPASNAMTLRTVVVAFAGLLAVGTAVRMVM